MCTAQVKQKQKQNQRKKKKKKKRATGWQFRHLSLNFSLPNFLVGLGRKYLDFTIFFPFPLSTKHTPKKFFLIFFFPSSLKFTLPNTP